jgi:hypothetical protein
MKRHARSLILVPSGTTTYDTLHPFDRSQLTTLGGHQDLKNIYAGVPKAYVILPPGATSPPEETNYKWEPVWRVFAHGFHVSLEDARYRKLTKDDIIHDYIRGDLEEKLIMPEDVFLVGVQDQQGNEPAWLFCLAADVDPDTNNLTLEFMMPSLSCKRFEEVSMYVKRLWEKDHWEPLTTAFGP